MTSLSSTFWGDVLAIDEWLDGNLPEAYISQPFAQDWARVAKTAEEAGEAIEALIGCSGQNPRKGVSKTLDDVLGELADVAWTGILAIQHFTKNTVDTEHVLAERLKRIRARVPTD